MINFKEAEVRESGLIYNGSFEQIKMLYQQNPQQAGELAISVIELTLTGQISTDDFMIQVLLQNQMQIVKKDKQKYDKRVAASEMQKIERLKQIAALYNQDYSQKEIADMLGKAKSTISEDIATIRSEYPDLLDEKKFGKFGKFGTDNDNENDNENDNVNDNDNENENDNEAVSMTAREKLFRF